MLVQAGPRQRAGTVLVEAAAHWAAPTCWLRLQPTGPHQRVGSGCGPLGRANVFAAHWAAPTCWLRLRPTGTRLRVG